MPITFDQFINEELNNVHICLCANKLSLNVEKPNFVMFHPSQKNLTFPIRLLIDDKRLSEKNCIKYLGLMIDCNLNWKCEIKCIAKKIKRNIGIISKLRHYVGQKILANIYYALVYPFSIYGILVWSNSYPSTIQPLFILQKWAMRIISFSKFDAPSSPLFRNLNIIKLHDLAIFILQYLFINFIIGFCLLFFMHFSLPLIKYVNITQDMHQR